MFWSLAFKAASDAQNCSVGGPKRMGWCFLLAFDFCFGEAEEDPGVAEKHPWHTDEVPGDRVFCLLKSEVDLF